MTFKGCKLLENSESELFINIKVTKNFLTGEEQDTFIEDLEDLLCDFLDSCTHNSYVDYADDKNLTIRCDDVTFDQNGVSLLASIYNDILGLFLEDIEISVGIHADEWFKDITGADCNEVVVSWDTFLDNISY